MFLASAAANVQASLVGNPPVMRLPIDTEVFPQNFAIAEDGDSILYVGNFQGVLTYDGARWHLIKLPSGGLVRALRYDGHRRVYVGGRNVFGYLERGAAGHMRFHDLSSRFAEELHGRRFGDIWDVVVTRAGVLFAGIHDLFFYDPASGATQTWHARERLGAAAASGGKMYVQFRSAGLKRLEGRRWVLVPGSAGLRQDIYRMVALPDGGLLLLAGNGKWREFVNGEVEPFAVPPEFLPASHFADVLPLPDGTLAMVADTGDVYFLDRRHRTARRLHLVDGDLGPALSANDGQLLVVGDRAIYHIEWPARWTALDSAAGLTGDLHRLVHWGRRWYGMSSAGVLRSTPDDAAGAVRFTRTGWTNLDTLDLLPIDSSSALVSSVYALDEVRNGRVHAIDPQLYPDVFARSRADPDVVYVGTETGFAAARRLNGRWQVILERTLEGVQGSQSLAISAPREVWLAAYSGGIYRLKLDTDYRIAGLHRFGPRDGLHYGTDVNANVERLRDGTIMASTESGEFRWNGRRFVRDDLGGLDKLRRAGEAVQLRQSPAGDLWAVSWKHVYHRSSGVWRAEDIARLRVGAIQDLKFDETGAAVVVAGASILRRDGHNHEQPPIVAPHAMLRSVTLVDADDHERPLPLSADDAVRLKGQFALRFAFALPDYGNPAGVSYEARLEGFEDWPTAWDPSSRFTYSHLSAGDYAFQVRARDAQGRVSVSRPFRFVVLPPWYAAQWALILWTAAALLGVTALAAFGIRWRTRRLAARTTVLEQMVTDRTEELEAANRQLRAMAHLDGLTGIPNRRRLNDYLKKIWAQCCQHGRALSVLLIDVDHFKEYNDRRGHLAGDELLKKLATILSSGLRRAEDILARYGGEEFLVALPGTDDGVPLDVAENLRTAVEAARIGVTVSVGLASCSPCAEGSVWDLVRAADEALYRAKALGRNRTVSAPRENGGLVAAVSRDDRG